MRENSGEQEGGLLQKISGFLEERGVNPAALAAVAIVVLLGAALFAFQALSAKQELRALVLSSGGGVDGALVEVFSENGESLASGTTQNGEVSFKGEIPSGGRVLVRVSKQGFTAPDGGRHAQALVDLSSRRKAVSFELYSSEVEPGDYSGKIVFSILDKHSRQPVAGALLNAVVGSQSFAYNADSQGRVVVPASKGSAVRVRVLADGYYSDVRAFTAIRGEEEILVSSRPSETLFENPSPEGELPLHSELPPISFGESILEDSLGQEPLVFSMPESVVSVLDSQGNALQSGTISVVSSSGHKIAQAQLVQGRAAISNLPLQPGFSLQFEGAPGEASGSQAVAASVNVLDPLSGTVVFSSALHAGLASLSTQPLSSLSVSVATAFGEGVSGLVRAYDSAASALLAESQLFNGLASFSSLQVAFGTKLKLVLEAQGFSAAPVEAEYGKQASARLVAVRFSAPLLATTVRAFAHPSLSPLAVQAIVYKQGDSTPVSQASFSGTSVFQLPALASGSYSIVFSSPGHYSLTISGVQAGASLDAVLVAQGGSATVDECVSFQGSRQCVQQSFSPAGRFDLLVEVVDHEDAPIADAIVSVADSEGRIVFSGRTNQQATAAAASLAAGSYVLAVSAQGSSASKTIALSANAREKIVLVLKGTLLLSAKSIQSPQPIPATFSIEGSSLGTSGSAGSSPVSSCTGKSCSLQATANRQLVVTASAPGYRTARAIRIVSAGQLLPASFELVPDSSQLEVVFRGARDSLGRPVSSLRPGQDYLLDFSLFSGASQETVFALRLGEKAGVAQEGYGIVEFQPEGFDSLEKSVSYSPQPTCVDLNNANSQEGLLKWVALGFLNRGAPLHKLFSIPVRVKPDGQESRLKIFYRLEARSSSGVARLPQDALLGSAENSARKAGCYAAALSEDLPVALAANSCSDATREGVCSFNSPLACKRSSSGSLLLEPSADCCPERTLLSQGHCLPVEGAPEGACVDGTAQGRCSLVNKPFACVAGELAALPSCCSPGEVFFASACRPQNAACNIGGRVFADGECLPLSPPFRCSDGVEISDFAGCGCPEGEDFNSATGTCGSSPAVACVDGTPAGSCSTSRPKQCLLLGGAPLLASNSVACGCPAGKISNGVECREPAALPPEVFVSPTPIGSTEVPSPTPSPTPFTPAASPTPEPQACSTPDRCLSPDDSDEYCNAQGFVQRSCQLCNLECGGSALLQCSPSTGACAPKKCAFPIPSGTSVEQCVEGAFPKRCVLSAGGVPEIIDSSASCGCRPGFKPDGQGRGCIACVQPNCEGEEARVCRDADGQWHAAGECLPEKFSSPLEASNGRVSEAIKGCGLDGKIVFDILKCGCPAGYGRSLRGDKCVLNVATAPQLPPLPQGASCSDCVNDDVIFFDESTGKLVSRSGRVAYSMQADPVFPADAMKLRVDFSSTAFRISVQKIESPTKSEACYSYDVASGVLKFRVGNACPVEVRGNKFFNSNTGEQVESDEVKIALRLESVPPSDLQLEVRVNFVAIDSLVVLPGQVEGSGTPQFIFAINEKQAAFGPRTLSITAFSTQNNELPGPGVKVLAWRGPGQLSISERDEQVASLSYDVVASYFQCFGEAGGPRVEQGAGGNAFACAGGWCNRKSFNEMLAAFKNYAKTTAQQTAFRRGNGEPFNTIIGGAGASQPGATSSTQFDLFTAAQVIDGAPQIAQSAGVSLSLPRNAQCSNVSRPGVYSIKASTGDGKSFKYSASVASLQRFDYVDGTCGDESQFVSDPSLARPDVRAQFVCNFLYGDCSCIQASSRSNFATARENKDGKQEPEPDFPFFPPFGGGPQQQPPGGSGQPRPSPPGDQQPPGGGGGPGGFPQDPSAPGGPNDPSAPGGPTSPDDPLGKLPPELAAKFLANTPADIKFGAEAFAEKCSEASEKFVNARRKSDEACGPKETDDERLTKRFSEKEGGAGKVDYWVDPEIGREDNENSGLCSPSLTTLQCVLASKFELEEEEVKNNGEIFKALDECEDAEHGNEKSETLKPFSQSEKCNIKKAFTDTEKKVEDEIKRATDECSEQCDAQGKTACFTEFSECMAGEKRVVELCKQKCAAFSNQAQEELDEKLGNFEKEFAVVMNNPTRQASGQQEYSCAKAVVEEISAGDSCEQLNEYLEEDAESILPPDPKKRRAWASCFAYGAFGGVQDAASASKEGGKCFAVCQSKHSFVQLGLRNNQVVQINRWGVGSASASEAGAASSSSSESGVAKSVDEAASQFGACLDRPPAKNEDVSKFKANDLSKLGAGARFTPQPGQKGGPTPRSKQEWLQLFDKVLADPNSYVAAYDANGNPLGPEYGGNPLEFAVNNIRVAGGLNPLKDHAGLSAYAENWARNLPANAGHDPAGISQLGRQNNFRAVAEVSGYSGLPGAVPDGTIYQGRKIPNHFAGQIAGWGASSEGHFEAIIEPKATHFGGFQHLRSDGDSAGVIEFGE